MYTDEGKGSNTGKFLVSSTGMLDCVAAPGYVGNQLFFCTLLSSVRIQLRSEKINPYLQKSWFWSETGKQEPGRNPWRFATVITQFLHQYAR